MNAAGQFDSDRSQLHPATTITTGPGLSPSVSKSKHHSRVWPALWRCRRSQACLFTSGLGAPARAIDASDGSAVRGGMSGHVKVCSVAILPRELRLGRECQPRNRVKWRLCFLPHDACILYPEISVVMLAPIGHLLRIQELDTEIEAADLAVLVHVTNEFVLQSFRVLLLQRLRRVGAGWSSRKLHDVNRPVPERHVAPIAKLLVRLDGLARLHLRQKDRPEGFQLVLEGE